MDRPEPARHEAADWWLVRALPGLMVGAGLAAVAAAVLAASHAGISHRAREVIAIGPLDLNLIYTAPSAAMVEAGLLTALALVFLVHGVEAWASRRVTQPARQPRQALGRPLRKEVIPGDWSGVLSVTALIPANNEEAHLPGTLSSLQNQTMPPAAIWVIADNCTDRTADVARAFGANVYTTVDNHHRKAGGLNQMLERLLPRMGPHDVVLVMDADTVMVDDFLERAIAEFTETPELSAVGGMFYGDDSAPGLRAQLQRNEYRRYSREIGRRKGKVFVLTGTASLFRADAFKAIAASRGSVLPGEKGQVYDTISLTEDNELTLALKTLGADLISPQGCKVRTELMPTWHDLWNQRQRWQRGALENIGMYGMTSATARYWMQQFGLGYGVLALAAYLALDDPRVRGIRYHDRRSLLGPVRSAVLRRADRHRVARRVAGAAGRRSPFHRARICNLPAGGVREVVVRHRDRPVQALERGQGRNLGLMTPILGSLITNRWFELLDVFVAFNTIVYATLAFGKLWPRRRK